MAPKLSPSDDMNTRVVLERFTPFKQDSARRIDRVIDYFGESPSMRGHLGGGRWRALFVVRTPQLRSRIESGVSVIVSLSARSR
jgi:hypothetical protein